MKNLQISEQLLNAIIGYLGTRPYQEVFQLINALHAEAQSQISMPEMAKSDEATKPVTNAA